MKWKVVDKDDKENADGTEGLSVTLRDDLEVEEIYTVTQAEFDALHVGKSYGLSTTPLEEATTAEPAKPVEAADGAAAQSTASADAANS